MNDMVAVLILCVSLMLGLGGLVTFLWGLRTNQFDDADKMMQGVLFDSEEDLNELVQKEEKLKSTKVKKE